MSCRQDISLTRFRRILSRTIRLHSTGRVRDLWWTGLSLFLSSRRSCTSGLPPKGTSHVGHCVCPRFCCLPYGRLTAGCLLHAEHGGPQWSARQPTTVTSTSPSGSGFRPIQASPTAAWAVHFANGWPFLRPECSIHRSCRSLPIQRQNCLQNRHRHGVQDNAKRNCPDLPFVGR